MGTIQTNDGSTYSTPGFWATAGGYVAGNTAAGVISQVANKSIASGPWVKKMQKLNNGIDTVEIRNSLNKALEVSGMKDKGVTIVDYAGQQAKTTKEIIAEFIENYKKMISGKASIEEIQKVANFQGELIKNQIIAGKNAGYGFATKEVAINTEKLGLSGFHEIGHAMNHQSSKFWGAIQKARMPLLGTVGLLTTIALFKRKKAEGEETHGVFDKVTTFIKENVGKLTTLAFVPIIAEELKASARGNKLAKQLLSPDVAKKVVKSNRFGAVTYIGSAITTGLAAFAANKVRDKIAGPKKVEAYTSSLA